jgi:hypothetical protein
MSWCDIIKKNTNIINEVKKEEVIIKNEVINPYSILNFKNIDDEFDHKYHRNILNISFELRNYISYNFLPFMDKLNTTYNIFDFMKENSYEYEKVFKEVKKYNNELIKEYDEEQRELEKEAEEEQEEDYV